MKNTSAENKQVPDRVHETRPFRIIKYDTEGIGQASDQQKRKSAEWNQLQQWFDREDDRPAHKQVENQR